MKEILQLATQASPLAVIAILALIIWQLVKNSTVIQKLRGTQLSDKDRVDNKEITDRIDLREINGKLNTIMTNHLHELPEMKKTLDRMEAKQGSLCERLAGVEAKVEILLSNKN